MKAAAEHVVAGLAHGGVYGVLALAIVLVRRLSGTINFAQGEFATLSAFVCLTLTHHGWNLWPAFGASVVLSFGGAFALEQTVIRPLHGGHPLAPVLLTVGLLLGVNGLDTWIWGSSPRTFPHLFASGSTTFAGATFSEESLGTIAAVLVCALVLSVLVLRTKIGLGLRAVLVSPEEARLAGIRAASMRSLGWGVAAALGAVAAVLAAPGAGLDPDLMRDPSLYALAGAVLGGLWSLPGALLGGVAIGVIVEVAGDYVHWVGGQLRPAIALAVLATALLVRGRS